MFQYNALVPTNNKEENMVRSKNVDARRDAGGTMMMNMDGDMDVT